MTITIHEEFFTREQGGANWAHTPEGKISGKGLLGFQWTEVRSEHSRDD